MIKNLIAFSLIILLGVTSSHSYATPSPQVADLSLAVQKPGFRKHNDFIAYGLISTNELEKAAARMSPAGANRTLAFVEEVHKGRLQAWLDAIPAREEAKRGMEVENLSAAQAQKVYLDALEKLRQIKARESIEIDGLTDLLHNLSYADRKVLAQMVYIPRLKPRREHPSTDPSSALVPTATPGKEQLAQRAPVLVPAAVSSPS